MADRVDDDRLAELRQRNSFLSSVDGRDISRALAELERRRAADTAPIKLVWTEHRLGSGWFGYSGASVRAMVLRVTGETDWSWNLEGISTGHVVQGRGKRKDPRSGKEGSREGMDDMVPAFRTCP